MRRFNIRPLLENSIEKIQDMFPDVPEKLIHQINEIDFTKNNREFGKLWRPILSLYKKSQDLDIDKLKMALELYKQYYYKPEMRSELMHGTINDYDSFTEFVEDVISVSSPVIFDDGEWTIRELNNKPACMYFAPYDVNNWCISRPDGSDYKKSYQKKYGDLYLVLNYGTPFSAVFVGNEFPPEKYEWRLVGDELVEEGQYERTFGHTSMYEFFVDSGILADVEAQTGFKSEDDEFYESSFIGDDEIFSYLELSSGDYEDFISVHDTASVEDLSLSRISKYDCEEDTINLSHFGEIQKLNLYDIEVTKIINVPLTITKLTLSGVAITDFSEFPKLDKVFIRDSFIVPTGIRTEDLLIKYISKGDIASLEGIKEVQKLIIEKSNLQSVKGLANTGLEILDYSGDVPLKLDETIPTLKTLKGNISHFGQLPKVMDYIYCTEVDSLLGSPEKVIRLYGVVGTFDTLKGVPKHIGTNFGFYSPNLKSVDYFPEYVGNQIEAKNHPEWTKLISDQASPKLKLQDIPESIKSSFPESSIIGNTVRIAHRKGEPYKFHQKNLTSSELREELDGLKDFAKGYDGHIVEVTWSIEDIIGTSGEEKIVLPGNEVVLICDLTLGSQQCITAMDLYNLIKSIVNPELKKLNNIVLMNYPIYSK